MHDFFSKNYEPSVNSSPQSSSLHNSLQSKTSSSKQRFQHGFENNYKFFDNKLNLFNDDNVAVNSTGYHNNNNNNNDIIYSYANNHSNKSNQGFLIDFFEITAEINQKNFE
jgi:hypothetical protein